MNIALILAELAIIAVFLAAGFAKLATFQTVKLQFIELGIPPRFGTAAVSIVAAAEIATALGIASSAFFESAVRIAMALMISYTIFALIIIARGTNKSCSCFGNLTDSAIGWRSVIRNIVIIVLLAFVEIAGDNRNSSIDSIGSRLDVATLISGFALVISFMALALCLLVIRSLGELRNDLGVSESSDISDVLGSLKDKPIPNLALEVYEEKQAMLHDVLNGDHDNLIIVTSLKCRYCDDLRSDIHEMYRRSQPVRPVTLIEIMDSPPHRIDLQLTGYGSENVGVTLFDPNGDFMRQMQIGGTPTLLLVDPTARTIRHAVLGTSNAIPIINSYWDG